MILIPVKAGTGNREFRPLAASWPQKRPPSAACPGTLRARPRGRGPRILFRAALARRLRLWALTAVPARPESGSSRAARAAVAVVAVTSVAPRRQLRLHAGGLAPRLAGHAASLASKSQVAAVARARLPPKASSDSPGAAPSVLPRAAGPWRVACSAPGRGRRHAARGGPRRQGPQCQCAARLATSGHVPAY